MNCNIDVDGEKVKKFMASRFKNKIKESTALVMVGGPGSGKSSGKENTLQLLELDQSKMVNIDPDEIITRLFDNDNKCRSKVNEINDYSFEKAVKEKYNLVFDGTGKNYDWYSKELIERLKDDGYKVYLCIVLNSSDVVVSRVKKRAAATGRDVPVSYIKYVYSELEKVIPKYIGLKCSDVDGIYVYDNKNKLKLLYKSSCDTAGKKTVQCFISCEEDYKLVHEFCPSCKRIQYTLSPN